MGVIHKWLYGCCVVALLMSANAWADAGKSMSGWEKESDYNRLYTPEELERLKGVVVAVEEQEIMENMAPATVLRLKADDDDEILVHLCPSAYIPAKETGIRKGDEVKIRGVWAEVAGEDVFMAAKVKKGDFFELKLRLTKDGTPFWTMTEEELEKEKNSD